MSEWDECEDEETSGENEGISDSTPETTDDTPEVEDASDDIGTELDSDDGGDDTAAAVDGVNTAGRPWMPSHRQWKVEVS